MNVLLLGSGGREHALAWKIKQSPKLDALYIAPGNPGTAQVGKNVDLSLSNHEQILAFIEDNDVDLTVVGPEKPLVEGITDLLEEKGHKVFGPSKSAAQLEGSKKFANNFMEKNRIPTADYVSFEKDEFDEALSYVQRRDEYPVVLKADGLAGGKGVFICETEDEVKKRLRQLKEDAKLSDAAETLVIEEFLEGEEASVFVISDGETAKIIHNAQDHKRIGEGDTGLNTGGMGAYCPAPVMTRDLLMKVEKEIVLPTISAMLLDETPYKGILYCGLMITDEGPKVVEYNCRFGDPECQAILPSLQSDLLELLDAAASGELAEKQIKIDDRYRCCVVMASGGYPKAYEKGKPITGIGEVSEDVLVFHAGTAIKNGQLVTDGGRVLNVVGSGDTLQEAIKSTYAEIEKINFENAYYRSDIGVKGLAHLEA
ncbi:phosphoribosylamine--glycine ligase [Halalkalibaculum sp. DA3122]|uniref:phosphoribosylamine--glycine ligase n=1 Tax=unclassified Halalkalibaculum TaxID=2964617 RepID=UPI00375509CF